MLKENALFETVKMQALPPPITLISSKHLHVILFKQPQEGLLSTYLKYEPRIRLYNYHMAIEEAEHKNLNDLESGDKKKRANLVVRTRLPSDSITVFLRAWRLPFQMNLKNKWRLN